MSAKGAAAKVLEDARRDIDELRDRIGDLASERKSVADAPCDRAEAARRVDAMIDLARRESAFRQLGLVAAPGGGRADTGLFNRRMTGPHGDAFAVLAELVPDQLKAAILAHVPGEGITEDARAARLANLDAEILAAEIAEETACREIEGAIGATIERRLDASPAILLAPDRELSGG